jgi:hypothetical protein
MSDAHADQIRHWLAVADDQDNQEKQLAARYTAAAAARLWVLHKLGGDSGDAPDRWAQVRELAEEADEFLDDDRQDEALYRRAQANLIALRLFEESDEPQRPNADDNDGDKADDDADDKEKETAGSK